MPSANADEESCEETGPKAAKGKFDAAIGKLMQLNICTVTHLNNANAERDALLTYLDGTVNRNLFCDSTSGRMIGGDDLGFVPADKSTLQCACTVGKNLSKLIARTLKCYSKLADSDFKQQSPPFDEEACEETTAHGKYTTAAMKLLGKSICPPCLGTAAAQDAPAADALNKADGEINMSAYPCP